MGSALPLIGNQRLQPWRGREQQALAERGKRPARSAPPGVAKKGKPLTCLAYDKVRCRASGAHTGGNVLQNPPLCLQVKMDYCDNHRRTICGLCELHNKRLVDCCSDDAIPPFVKTFLHKAGVSSLPERYT